MSKEIRCDQGLTKEEYLKSYCKSMSRESLELHWAGVFFECLENGMEERGDATDFYNVLQFIKSKDKSLKAGWISVNERLPNPGDRIDICRTYRQIFDADSKYYIPPHRVTNLLVEECNDDGKYLVAVDTRDILRGTFSAPSDYCHLNGDYSHWMLTPTLPKDFAEEQEKCLNGK